MNARFFAATHHRRGCALLSLHDVTPAHDRLVRTAIDEIASWGAGFPALLVVPDYHGGWPMANHPDFVEFLRQAKQSGGEILLHGYDHLAPRRAPPSAGLIEKAKERLLTAGEGEFQHLGFSMAVDRLQKGRTAIKDALGWTPKGFVAPAWLEHRETEMALQTAEFEFHENHLYIDLIRSRRRVFVPAITFTARSPRRTKASLLFAMGLKTALGGRCPVRLALHPLDFASSALIAAIRDLVERISANRDWISYGRFCSEGFRS
jgi:hypothetical protein